MPKSKPGPKPTKLPKFPLRTCVVCRTIRKKEDLLRLPQPAKAGRGVYVCPQECLIKLQSLAQTKTKTPTDPVDSGGS